MSPGKEKVKISTRAILLMFRVEINNSNYTEFIKN